MRPSEKGLRGGWLALAGAVALLVVAPACSATGAAADVPDPGGSDADAVPAAETGDSADRDVALLDTAGDAADVPAAPTDCGWAWGEMVTIPAGVAIIGEDCTRCDLWEAHRRPAHPVTVAAFAIDTVPVTNEAFAAFLDVVGERCGERCLNYAPKGPPDLTRDDIDDLRVPGKERLPVVWVTWVGARAFCESHGRRLCSEVEWEVAALGYDGRIWPWGDELPGPTRGNCGWPCGWPYRERVAVGCFPEGAAPSGALDMVGNTAELVEDDWHRSYDGAPATGAPWIDEPRAHSRTLRGTGLLRETFPVHLARPASRECGDSPVAWSSYDVGFRCCADR